MKNNTEQNGSDEKYSQAGIIVKIHTNHDGVRETQQSRWGSSRLAYYGDMVIGVKQVLEITTVALRVHN